MAYAYYEINRPDGRPMKRGYSVECKCHFYGCTNRIDRGLNYLCYHCTWYYCAAHRTCIFDRNEDAIDFDCFAGQDSQICKKCEKDLLKDKLFIEDFINNYGN